MNHNQYLILQFKSAEDSCDFYEKVYRKRSIYLNTNKDLELYFYKSEWIKVFKAMIEIKI